MEMSNLPSKLLEHAVNEFSKLPGVGKKTALRLVLYILNQEKEYAVNFGKAIIDLRENIVRCKKCNNISDTEICSICSNKLRDHEQVCVVENTKDVMALENTHQYNGVYHVLGGLISPMDGIGPNDINIDSLIEKVKSGNVKEVIFALSTTMEGDTTNFYIYRKISEYTIDITTLARGVAIGDDLEYTDEITLARSITNRTPFETTLKSK